MDLEFTAWEGSMARNWSGTGEKKEVVQFGAVKLRADDLSIVDTFEVLVRPRFNPVLSGYLIELTGITNDAVAARGIDFVTGYSAFLDFAGSSPLWAFGRDDIVLKDNLRLYSWEQGADLPPYFNVIPWFAALGIDLNGKHASDVPEAANLVFDGRKHDALDDARGIAAAIAKCVAAGAANPFTTLPT
jgi:inhibitor of KinA sporulation pathway (predicted exonuclease)